MNQNDEWYTPPPIIERVRRTFGQIDLDPTSSDIAQNFVKASAYFTKEDNSLQNDWWGSVYMNPPYSNRLIKQFTKKITDEYDVGNVKEFIVLTNSGTDTLWNKPLQRFTQVYTNGRIQFMLPNGCFKKSGSRGQCFTYAGPNRHRFIYEFTNDDFCWLPNGLSQ